MAVILIVDDEPDALEMFRLWLIKYDYKVLTVASGREAIETARNSQPDLVLLDVMMPNMTGIETCRELRSLDETAHIPVVLITAYDPAVGRVEALMAGAADYITKPVRPAALVQRLRVVLAHEEEPLAGDLRLLRETVHSALAIVPCNLVWLLILDTSRRALVSQIVATTKGERGVHEFIARVAPEGNNEIVIPFSRGGSLLAQVALSGAALFNLPLSKLREAGDAAVYQGCSQLDLYFVSILPLQVAGTPLGVMLLGSREPRDVETTRGQQLLAAVASQAAMAIYNDRLMRRLSEREAQSNRERLFRQTLLDTMSDGLVVYDSGGRISFANRRLSQITGYDLEALCGRQLEELFIPEDRERLRPWVYKSRTDKTRSFELELQRSDGSILPVLAVQAGRSVSQTQESRERVMVITDLSKHKAREHALTEHADLLSALNRTVQAIASTPSMDEALSTALNNARRILRTTPATALLWVPDADELVVHSAIGPDVAPLNGMRFPSSAGVAGKAAHDGRPLLIADLCRSEYHPHPVEEVTGAAICSAAAAPLMVEGHVVGVIEVAHTEAGAFDQFDLEMLEGLAHAAAIAIGNARLYTALLRRATQLEAACTDLQEADRLKAQWIQNVSYELRTLLTSLMSYIDPMLEEDFGSLTPDQRKGLGGMADKTRQLSRLVEGVLTIQQAEEEPLDLTLVSLCDLAQASMQSMAPIAEQAGIELVADFDSDLPAFYMDSRCILQVFDNLIGNAIKFSPEGGRVTVCVEDIGPAAKVQVIDQGIGIPPDEQEKIWRRFYQVNGSSTRPYSGAGLGLAIAKQVVEEHNGRIWVESSPGQGSIFGFILPKVTSITPPTEEGRSARGGA